MSQHYTKNTSRVMHWCPTCKRHTMHRVDYKRLGSCTEHGAPEMTKAQEKRLAAIKEAEENPEFDF